MGVIYLRKNKINGKKYVGQVITKRFKARQNRWKNLKYPYAGTIINNARAKYGIDAFDFEILKECKDEELNQWEMYYIKELNTKTPNGYNMTDGGDSNYEITDETKKKMSEAQRGKKRSNETRKKMSAAKRGKPNPKVAAAMRGKKHSPEHIEKIAAAHRGMKRSDETKAKMSAAQKNNPKCSKAVQALDKDGNIVMEFASTREAQRKGFDSGCISQCCNGKRKTHKGFIWRFKENKFV